MSLQLTKQKTAFLRHLFGGGDLSSDGENLTVKCPNPACSSRAKGKRKFAIHLARDQGHCWVCELKAHASLAPIINKYMGKDAAYEYVTKYLTNNEGQRNFKVSDSNQAQDETVLLPEGFRPLFLALKKRDPQAQQAWTYLKNRGIEKKDLWYYKFGIADDYKYRNRVIIPSFDADGYVNTYVGRSIEQNAYLKYMLPKIDKISVIFNEINIDWKQTLTIVEGPFDLVKCNQNATCLLGSGLSENYLLFWKIIQHKTPIILALDADAMKKVHRYSRLLSQYNIDVKLLDVGTFNDVGEMSKEEFLNAKLSAKSWNSFDDIKHRISLLS